MFHKLLVQVSKQVHLGSKRSPKLVSRPSSCPVARKAPLAKKLVSTFKAPTSNYLRCQTRGYSNGLPNGLPPLMGLSEFQNLLQELDGKNPSTPEEIEEDLARRADAKKRTVKAFPHLENVVKMDLLSNETPENITTIWQSYHKSKYCLSGVIKSDQFLSIYNRISVYPSYVVPLLRKKGGVEFFFFQQKDNFWLFTPLAQLKTQGTNALPVFTAVFYNELMDDKGLVLMRSNIDTDILDIMECQFLINKIQSSYLEPKQYEIVKEFHKNPETFDWNKLLTDLPVGGVATHEHGPNCNHDHDHDHHHDHHHGHDHVHGPNCNHDHGHHHKK